MKFGYIAPINYLQYIPEHADFHLILAHLLTDIDYVKFYNERYAKGDYILLDNSTFEFGRPIEADELLKLIDDSGININCVVAPDYPGQHQKKTIASAYEFEATLRKLGRDYDVMVVPQSEKGDVLGWFECYLKFVQDDRFKIIGMSILGIPNAFYEATGTTDISHNRIFATSYINRLLPTIFSTKWHHYLGLGSNAREMQIIKQFRFKELTNDSSSPIWHGCLGIPYDESGNGLIAGKSKLAVDFHYPTGGIPDNDQIIRSNVDWMETNVIK